MSPRKAAAPSATAPETAAEQAPAVGDDAAAVTASAVPASPPAPAQPAWHPMPERTAAQTTRAVGLTIALILLAVACIVAFYSAMRIASIWFEDRFVPIVHLGIAGVTIAICITAVRRLRAPA